MQIDEFLKLVPAAQQAKSRPATLELWCHIYMYIEQSGYADTADDDDFLSHVHKLKYLSSAAIAGHLRTMASNGIIEGHIMRINPGQRNKFNIMPLIGDMLPSQFIRYTLPGKEVPTHMKRATRAHNEMARIANDAFHRLHHGPKEVTSLSDVGDLRMWLSGLYTQRETVSTEENERLQKLVADAGKLLREQEAEIRKFYTAVAVRSNLEPGI